MEMWFWDLQGGMSGWADGGCVTSVNSDSLLEVSARFWDSCVDFSGQMDILGRGHTSVWPWREGLIWMFWGVARAPGGCVRRAKLWTLQRTKHAQWMWSITVHFIAIYWVNYCSGVPDRILIHYSMTFSSINSMSSGFTLKKEKCAINTWKMHLSNHKHFRTLHAQNCCSFNSIAKGEGLSDSDY